MKLLFLIALASFITTTISQPNAHGVTPSAREVSECPVCFDSLQPNKTIHPPCAHAICEVCYNGIFNHQAEPSCPLCRGSYTGVTRPVPAPIRSRPADLPRNLPISNHNGNGGGGSGGGGGGGGGLPFNSGRVDDNQVFREARPVNLRNDDEERNKWRAVLVLSRFLFGLFEECLRRRVRD